MNALYLTGWVFLVLSWVVPYNIRKIKKDNETSYIWGMILSAIAIGVFTSGLVIQLIS
jgi:hypothetical protein